MQKYPALIVRQNDERPCTVISLPPETPETSRFPAPSSVNVIIPYTNRFFNTSQTFSPKILRDTPAALFGGGKRQRRRAMKTAAEKAAKRRWRRQNRLFRTDGNFRLSNPCPCHFDFCQSFGRQFGQPSKRKIAPRQMPRG